jgi:hypothetical protein
MITNLKRVFTNYFSVLCLILPQRSLNRLRYERKEMITDHCDCLLIAASSLRQPQMPPNWQY